jgi:hypothetical protein
VLLLTADPGDALPDAARPYDLRASHAPVDLRRKDGAAALALAAQSSGIALDMLGFIIGSPGDLIPRSR